MKTISLRIPDSVDVDEKELSLKLLTQLYDKGKLTLGQAAKLAGMTKQEFMQILGKYEISIFGETLEDIERDSRNA